MTWRTGSEYADDEKKSRMHPVIARGNIECVHAQRVLFLHSPGNPALRPGIRIQETVVYINLVPLGMKVCTLIRFSRDFGCNLGRPKAAKMFQSGSCLLAENAVSPVLVLARQGGSWSHSAARSKYQGAGAIFWKGFMRRSLLRRAIGAKVAFCMCATRSGENRGLPIDLYHARPMSYDAYSIRQKEKAFTFYQTFYSTSFT